MTPSSVTAAAAGIGSREVESRSAPRTRRLVTLGGLAFLQGRARAELALPGQRLLTFLGLRGGSLQRSYVAGTPWQEASLRSAHWRVHRAAPGAIEAPGWLDRDGVVGVGEGEEGGERVIVVWVLPDTDLDLPERLDGVPVSVRESGELRAR